MNSNTEENKLIKELIKLKREELWRRQKRYKKTVMGFIKE